MASSGKPVPSMFLGICLILGTVTITYSSLVLEERSFLNYDDNLNYVNNHYIRMLSVKNFLAALFKSMDGEMIAVFEPVSLLFKMVLVRVLGSSAGSILATNLVLHIANTVASVFTGASVVSELRRIAGVAATAPCASNWQLYFAALCFGVHPLFVESVAWASCLPYLLCAFFTQISVYSHIQISQQRCSSAGGFFWGVLEVVFFGLACLSKTSSVSVVGFLIVMDFMANAQTRKTTLPAQIAAVLLRNTMTLMVAVLTVLCALQADSKGVREGLVRDLAIEERFMRASYMPLFYARKLVFPVSLAVRYPLPDVHLGTSTVVVACLLLNIVLGALCAKYVLGSMSGKIDRKASNNNSRLGSAISATWVGYLVLLAPTLGFVSSHVQCMASDRYAYIPALLVVVPSFSIAIHFVDGLILKKARVLWQCFLGLVVAALIFQTQRQVRVWKSDESLWTHASEVSPSDAMVMVNLGVTLNDQNRPVEALHYIQQAILLRPSSHTAHGTAGIILFDAGHVEEAIVAHRRGLALEPLDTDRHYSLGVALKAAGAVTEAAHHYRTVVEFTPEYSQAWNNLGSILQTGNNREEAEFSYKKAIAINPSYSDAYSNLGVLYHTGGQLQQAIDAYRSAIEGAPTHANARTNLGLALSAQAQAAGP
jgi:Flp pilus assembly protein TadD